MKITIIGAGPVGLMTACLLSSRHEITLLEKREEYTRNHLLNIDNITLDSLQQFIIFSPISEQLGPILDSWRNNPVGTSEMQHQLLQIAIDNGVKIRTENVQDVDSISDSIIIAADGARSTVRRLIFGDQVDDIHTISYMAQFKFTVPGRTKPRSTMVGMSHNFLNGFTGNDIVLTFESMARTSSKEQKSGTLHIPIPLSVYEILSRNGRGNVERPWTISELERISDPTIAKLVRVIKRYRVGVNMRGGLIENGTITVLPLTIYRSPASGIQYRGKNLFLCGDSSSGLVLQRGLQKGFLESIKCAEILSNSIITPSLLTEYNTYCRELYEKERNVAMSQGRKIESGSKSISVGSQIIGLGLLTLVGSLLLKSSFHT